MFTMLDVEVLSEIAVSDRGRYNVSMGMSVSSSSRRVHDDEAIDMV